jgi:hypothetical protein
MIEETQTVRYCDRCQDPFPENELVTFSIFKVCAKCKIEKRLWIKRLRAKKKQSRLARMNFAR